MSGTAIAYQQSSYLFPAKQGQQLPIIGQGFDLIGAQAIAASAFDPPAASEMNVNVRENSNSKYFAIFDKETFNDAAEFDYQTSGGGWGVQAGMSFSASSRVDSTSTTFTVHLNAAKTISQCVVKAGVMLSPQAAIDLKSLGIGGFIAKYGTHFVAGYVFGKSCKASYNMSFHSLDMMLAFTAQYNESGSELGFSESTKANLANLTQTSQTKYTESVEANCVGFNAVSPGNFADLITLKRQYDEAAPSEKTAVSVIVLPWQYLDQLNQSSSGLKCNNSDAVNTLLNDLTYIAGSSKKFVANRLYAGHTQLQNLRGVQARAEREQDSILKIVADSTASGTPVTVEDGDQLSVNGTLFPYAQDLLDDLKFAMEHFAISWKTQIAGGANRLYTELKSLNGSPIQVSPDGFTVDGTGGTYFTWSIEGNDAWEGTRNTQTMSYSLAHFNAFPWNLAIVLDRENGTIQCWGRGPDQTLAQNPRSPVQVIRGSACSKRADDPTNSEALVWEGNGGYFWVSPI